MARSSVSSTRRGFLISIGSGGVVAAAAALSAVSPSSQSDKKPDQQDAARGYQLSEHITKYYRTTRA